MTGSHDPQTTVLSTGTLSSGGLSSAGRAGDEPVYGLARIPRQPDRRVSCRRCSAGTSTAQARITGAWSVHQGTPVWDCADCTRANLAELELNLQPR